MSDASSTGDTFQKRLQLTVGLRAELGSELPAVARLRRFAAVSRNDRRPMVVTVHPAPPAGPDPALLVERATRVRELDHKLLDAPIAAGEVVGCAWAIEPIPGVPSARARLASGPMPLAQSVSAVRDLARVLAAAHRRGIVHGAIDYDSVYVGDAGARIGGFARALDGSVRGDLDDVAAIAWTLLCGEPDVPPTRLLSSIRRGVPQGLDELCVAMNASSPRHRPQSAGAMLQALDAVPTKRGTPVISLVDVGTNDGRPQRGLLWLVVGAALLVLFGLLEFRA